MKSMKSIVFICLVTVSFLLGAYLVNQSPPEGKIKVEAIAPTAVHPISGDLGSGYILVEIWTKTKVRGVEVDVPHIVRMTRYEYTSFMGSL
jgi:hypothetical protein